MLESLDNEVKEMAAWLGDPRNAEPCATFPIDPERVGAEDVCLARRPGANEIVRAALGGGRVEPIYAGQAGASSAIAARPSRATLKSRIIGQHLRGNTRASTFRRTLAVLLWDELSLTRTRTRTLDAESNARLSGWIMEHLSVATAPVAEGSRLGQIEDGILVLLDPPLNLMKVSATPGRTKLRGLRNLYMGAVGGLGST